MSSQANWAVIPVAEDSGLDADSALFFDPHQWAVIEAATARIIPTDHDPGAREAGAVRFIDRYLGGYVYASADGTGFLRLEGKEALAWQTRIAALRQTYAAGIGQIEQASATRFGHGFVELDAEQQDQVLAEVSGHPKPRRFTLPPRAGAATPDAELTRPGQDIGPGEGGAPPSNQPVPDDVLDFFPMLVLHTRQGFYADSAYGGNRDHIGWQVIGFPGPDSLRQTQLGQYSTVQYMLPDASWPFA